MRQRQVMRGRDSDLLQAGSCAGGTGLNRTGFLPAAPGDRSGGSPEDRPSSRTCGGHSADARVREAQCRAVRTWPGAKGNRDGGGRSPLPAVNSGVTSLSCSRCGEWEQHRPPPGCRCTPSLDKKAFLGGGDGDQDTFLKETRSENSAGCENG